MIRYSKDMNGAEIPNAEKWTEMYTLSILHEIRWKARDVETLYLGRALADLGLYAHVWRYWKKKWRDNNDVMDIIYNVEALFEAKLYEAALFKRIDTRIAMMGLKRNHGWKDEDLSFAGPPAEPVDPMVKGMNLDDAPGSSFILQNEIWYVGDGPERRFYAEGYSPSEQALKDRIAALEAEVAEKEAATAVGHPQGVPLQGDRRDLQEGEEFFTDPGELNLTQEEALKRHEEMLREMKDRLPKMGFEMFEERE